MPTQQTFSRTGKAEFCVFRVIFIIYNNLLDDPISHLIVNEIQSSNMSPKQHSTTISSLRPNARSLSSVIGKVGANFSSVPNGNLVENNFMHRSTESSSSQVRQTRKYFDSGDYELAKAGILSASSVGSIHASPEKIVSSSAVSRSNSSHHLNRPMVVFDAEDAERDISIKEEGDDYQMDTN
jgi:hypothetical protein